MRSFAVWLVMTLAIFGLVAGGYHWYLTNNPRRVLVVVDTSFPMQPYWKNVKSEIQNLASRRYTIYAVITEKQRIHGWSRDLNLGTTKLFAPRNLSILTDQSKYPEFMDATEIHLITNASEARAQSPNNWIVHVVGGSASDG